MGRIFKKLKRKKKAPFVVDSSSSDSSDSSDYETEQIAW